MTKEKRIVFRLSEEDFEIFKELCDKNNKSISLVLREYINKVIKKKNNH